LLKQNSFSPSICCINAHPPALLCHIHDEYSVAPFSKDATKFWSVFSPVSERLHNTEQLVLGSGAGSGDPDEFVVEVVTRGGKGISGRRNAVSRVLEGWKIHEGMPCSLSEMTRLKTLWKGGIGGPEAVFILLLP
jgi:elongator complex protein 5